MPQYSTQDLIGKTLIANAKVNLKRLPMDAAPVIYTVKEGQPVGVLYSYIAPGKDNARLYWMFKDSVGRSYYAEHIPGSFKTGALAAQGVLTSEQKAEADAKANEGFLGWLERNVKTLAVMAGVVIVGKALIQRSNGSK